MNQQGGTLAPGFSRTETSVSGLTTINGGYSLSSAATLEIQLGGLDQGFDYDFVNATGSVGLEGILAISFLNDFDSLVTNTDEFFILESSSALTGAFANVANGEYIKTLEGHRFLVSYGAGNLFPKRVVLSDFQLVPEPSTALLLTFGLSALAVGRRRGLL